MRPSRTNHTPFRLTPNLHKTIDLVANGLAPGQLHSFLLRVSQSLQISQQNGHVSNPQVNGAISQALAEVPDAR